MSAGSSSAERDARALAAINSLQAAVSKLEYERREPVAVVGLGCRFPKAKDWREFWNLLASGTDASSDVPPDRWNADAFFDDERGVPGKMITRRGSFLDDIASFDAGFFGISPREAVALDPQQRLLLEVTWEAIQDAACPLPALARAKTGVFVGLMNTDYLFQLYQHYRTGPAEVVPYIGTGNMHYAAANRLSYAFGWNGPSLTVDTACSSSLVAIHLACEALRTRQADAAVAGGVQVILHPEPSIYGSSLGALSADGRCKAFAANADGYGRGEGCGIVVLKRLSDALADGDRIWGTIVGSAVNHVGRVSGLTVPNQAAQEEVIRAAMAVGGVSPDDVGYIETHGTGTLLGDPIEVEALRAVFGARTKRCPIGSVKSNIGHLEAGAGVAGLIKVLLAMRHRQLPPTLHVDELNPHIPFDQIPLEVQKKLGPWPSDAKLVAGVSSFGIAGTNAHVVVEGPPAPDQEKERAVEAAAKEDRPHVLAISAKSRAALEMAAAAFAKQLEGGVSGGTWRDVCFTSTVRSTHHKLRVGVVGRSAGDLAEKLRAYLRGEHREGIATGEARDPAVAFVFTGQGPQWRGMGRALFEHEPVYRDTMRRCDALAKEIAGFSLIEEIDRGEPASRLDHTSIGQVAIVGLQISLVELLKSWGVFPEAVLGHSVGEISAAHVAGILSLEDAVHLAVERGRLLERSRGEGRMASVDVPFEEADALVRASNGRLSIAAVNSPTATVLSGDAGALEDALARLRSQGRTLKDLGVEYAFHSAKMDRFVEELTKVAERFSPRTAEIPIASTLTGAFERGEAFQASYWGRQVRERVRFMDAVKAVIESGLDTFVEIGPHPVLASAIVQTGHQAGATLTTVASLRKNTDDAESILHAVASLHCHGYPVDWPQHYGVRGRVVDLPSYPWQKERYWISAPTRVVRDGHPLLERHLELAHQDGVHVWETALDLDDFPYLRDHVVLGRTIAPGMLFAAMALAAGREIHGDRFDGIAQLSFESPLPIVEGLRLQIVVSPEQFRVSSRQGEGPWRLHARGVMVLHDGDDPARRRVDLGAVKARCSERIDASRLYDLWQAIGFEFGPRLRACRDVHRRAGEVLAEVGHAGGVDPVLLDAVFHGFVAASAGERATYVPISIDRIRVCGDPSTVAWSHGTLEDESPVARRAEAVLLDREGAAVVEVLGIRLSRVERTTGQLDPSAFEIAWKPSTSAAAEAKLDGIWWIVEDDRGVARKLAERLESRGARVVLARGSLDAAADELARGTSPWRAVVDLRALDLGEAQPSGDALRRGVWGPLSLVQAIAKKSLPSPPRLWLVTRGARSVRPEDAIAPMQAATWGVGITLPHEHPELRCTMIDLDPASVPSSASAVEGLVGAIVSGAPHERIAIRGGTRLVERLVPARASAPLGQAGGARIRSDATYAITGGLGGLGLAVAGWLVDQGAKHLVLLGRSASGDSAAAAVKALRDRAEVRVARADVSDAASIAAALRSAPPIRGIFHCAGVADDAIAVNMTVERIENVFTKAIGAWNLHELTRRDPLDYFVLFSSAASVLGSAAQTNYAAANAVLDAIAHERRRLGLPATTINWGPWSEVGMAARAGSNRFRGLRSIAPKEGVALLDEIVSSGHAQIVAVGLDVQSSEHGFGELPLLSDLGRAPEATPEPKGKKDWRRRIADAPASQRARLVEEYLQTTLAKVLGVAPSSLDPTTPMQELGFDSLMVVQLRVRLETDLGAAVTAAEIFANATIRRMTQLVIGKLANVLPAAKPEPGAARAELADRILAAPENRRAKLLENTLQEWLAKVLQASSPESLDVNTPLAEFGFDSLMVVQLRVRIETSLQVAVSAAEIFANATISRLARLLLSKLDATNGAIAPEPPTGDRNAAPSAAPRDDDAVAAELEKELRDLETKGTK